MSSDDTSSMTSPWGSIAHATPKKKEATSINVSRLFFKAFVMRAARMTIRGSNYYAVTYIH